jgi:hypothetical protein
MFFELYLRIFHSLFLYKLIFLRVLIFIDASQRKIASLSNSTSILQHALERCMFYLEQDALQDHHMFRMFY